MQGEEKEAEKEAGGEGEEEDEDDGFFVPHGYLSNDEGDHSDSEERMALDDPRDVRLFDSIWLLSTIRQIERL